MKMQVGGHGGFIVVCIHSCNVVVVVVLCEKEKGDT